MKNIILLFSLALLLNANSNLQELFRKLNDTPTNDKYKIVNKIKVQILKLNTSQRMEAISHLKKQRNINNRFITKHIQPKRNNMNTYKDI